MEFYKMYGDMFKFLTDHPMAAVLIGVIIGLELYMHLYMPYAEQKRMRRKPDEQIHHQNKLPDDSLLSNKAEGVILVHRIIIN